MPKIALSDVGLRSLQAPQNGQLDYWDTTLPGFGVRVSQGGSKTFIVNIDKARRTIGRYPILKLSDARVEAKRMFAEKTLGKTRPQAISYEQATKLFVEEKAERRRARTVAAHKRHLSLLGFKGQVADITHQDLERKLKYLPPSEFNHRLASAKTFFRWAQRKRYRQDDPTIGLSPHTRPTRDRVLTDEEVVAIWKACSLPTGEHFPQSFATIVKLLILTGQRRGEIGALRASYISKDLCTIPAHLAKNGREHPFPLGSLAASLVPPKHETASTDFLFPARGNEDACFSGWSKCKTALDKVSGTQEWTLHDIRRTVATRMAELGVAPHIIERLLNHVTGTMSPLARIYNRALYIAEMRDAIDKWEGHLSKLLART